MTNRSAAPNFGGLRVLALESRRAAEVGALIATYGGTPLVAPALREVPLESNTDALEFAARLLRGEFDITVFMTGVGTRALLSAIETRYGRDDVLDALRRTRVVARGPKPLAVLRELSVPVWVNVPEPNTWRELVQAVDARKDEQPLEGARIALQEYGVSNAELLDELDRRGARVLRVPVYRWALPEDVAPLREAVQAVADGRVDVAMFTTGVQLVHLCQVAGELGLASQVRRGLSRAVIGSIGPSTSDEIRRRGLEPDLEASHPKFGLLVRELAERAGALLRLKRSHAQD